MTNIALTQFDRETETWAARQDTDRLRADLNECCTRMGELLRAGDEYGTAEVAATYRAIRGELLRRR